ncbi:hypothetical protein ACFFLZ_12990 [Photobacterium aphoticum]|uniref:Uncharacterized protein n=2 Tax=Photobacterium aphoticum TaxID=754436 RepID=A0A0J1GM94_9GAMM|nr:hypothetical protein [Photobacterium aphoticum]KLV00858.1 hypothetical protein ABT58_10600 [Photobacterium aphoticum]PSU55834.1 hypothetical protein C9I90_14935 [Photobacterium aphoticum]GHA52640.1 hypothetical protein GCM10007086_28410 [Photobacterium aphoticum]
MKKLLLLAAVLLPFGYLFWLPVKMLAHALWPTDVWPSAPLSHSIMADIRDSLESQPRFRGAVAKHQGPAKRYLYNTPMTAYTTVDVGLQDIYAVYINGEGEWVVRLGLLPDKNAETYFSQQVGGVLGYSMGVAMKGVNLALEYGVLSPRLYHVTDKPETSFTSDRYQAVPRLID